MKLEKLNDNQIRCTLSKADLDKRELRLSELAYGSAKARALFRDMIQQASIELGFEADNIPLMIEAIPISSDCLVLVVTKVEDPEELDTRFSRFSRLSDDFSEEDSDIDTFEDSDLREEDFSTAGISLDDEILSFGDSSDSEEGRNPAEDALDLIAPFTQAIAQAKKEVLKRKKEAAEKKNGMQMYIFPDLNCIIELSAFLVPFFTGNSILYKDQSGGSYILFLIRDDSSAEFFQRACMIASDYGNKRPASYSALAHCKEHYQLMFHENALQVLNQLNN